MSDDTVTLALVDRWLATQRDALVADLITTLDLKAGLQDVLVCSRREAVAEDLSETLDLKAGLAAIVPESRPWEETRQGTQTSRELGEEDEWTTIKALTIAQRWDLRRDMLSELERAHEIAAELASAYDEHRPAQPAGLTTFDWPNWIMMCQPRFDELRTAVDLALEERGAFHIRGSLPVLQYPKEELLSHWSERRIQAREITRRAYKWRNEVAHGSPAARSRGNFELVWKSIFLEVRELSQRLADTIHAVNDFVGEDLREAGLYKHALDGLRWSTQTRWPTEWQDEIDRDSVPIGNGIFEVRQGNTRTSLV